MKFDVGQTIGDYELIDILESSKSGVAFKVRNTLAQRFEVLRILPPNLHSDPEKVERFLREIKVHARIIHPNIVTFYNAARIDNDLIMTTELVEGVPLAQRLEVGPIPWKDAVGFACQLLAGLACAHEHGVVHRDIAPANIIVTPEGAIKLTGFGLAKSAGDPQLTQAGAVMGSLHYISPEQVKGVSALDARADIYSCGVVLYEMVTGCKPFDARSQFEVMAAHVTAVPKRPREIVLDVPTELEAIILHAMAKDPSQRFQTAGEFRQHLESLVAGKAPETRPAPPREEPISVPAGLAQLSNAMISAAGAQANSSDACARPSSAGKRPISLGHVQVLVIGACLLAVMSVVFFLIARMIP